MQEREKEGCWFMTKGHVYYQEPNRVASQICISTVKDYVKTVLEGGLEVVCQLHMIHALPLEGYEW